MKWSSGDMEVWRYLPVGYERDRGDFNDYFLLLFQHGILQVVTIDTWGVFYHDLRQELGLPEAYIRHETTPQDDLAIFASKGVIALVGRIPGSPVLRLQYYAPMPLEEYLSSWGQFRPEERPWPSRVPEKVDKLNFVPGQTQRSDVEAVLGPPDFEWAGAEAGTRIVYYRIPGRWGSFHRFDYRNEILIWMNVKVWRERYTIASAVDRLGQVGAVLRARYIDVSPPIQYYFWPEQGTALAARMEQVSQPIKTKVISPYGEGRVFPNGADVVIAYIRFEPISLDLSRCAEIARKIDEDLGDLESLLFVSP